MVSKIFSNNNKYLCHNVIFMENVEIFIIMVVMKHTYETQYFLLYQIHQIFTNK